MKTTETIILNANSGFLPEIGDKSVDLVVTSPPYPMIEMWDELFAKINPSIKDDLLNFQGQVAFEKMHDILNKTWEECDRVLKDNGFVCINIGDATRTIDGNFSMYSNHTKIIEFFQKKGYSVLPDILWRKQSNSPNKFMGSGMYPAGAYVTYEHEYILIFRKGSKRTFNEQSKLKRRKSAYFWEERNVWFSDLWEIKGTSQVIETPISARKRNASFPFEIPYRLVNMYSVEDDVVLDPFCGFGLTNLACICAKRNSIGVDIEKEIYNSALDNLSQAREKLNTIIEKRIIAHNAFISSLSDEKREKCYKNKNHNFLVKTKQEQEIFIHKISEIQKISENRVECRYED